MTSRPVLTALLVAGLAGPATASSWICSDPETEVLREKLARAQKVIEVLKTRTSQADQELHAKLREAETRNKLLTGMNQGLQARVRELEKLAFPKAPEQGWAQAIEKLRRDGDVNVGLSNILERMDARALAPHRLRRLAQRLARYDGVLEAALETPAPKRELERFGVILDKVERHADALAANIVRRLEKLQASFGPEFSPAALDTSFGCDFGCGGDDLDDDDFGYSGGGLGEAFDDDFGDF